MYAYRLNRLLYPVMLPFLLLESNSPGNLHISCIGSWKYVFGLLSGLNWFCILQSVNEIVWSISSNNKVTSCLNASQSHIFMIAYIYRSHVSIEKASVNVCFANAIISLVTSSGNSLVYSSGFLCPYTYMINAHRLGLPCFL
jgi:hypothetical protein